MTSSIGPGRDQHGHRRRAGHDQPDPRAAAARRHVRHPRRRARAAGARTRRRRRHLGQRRFRPVSRYFDRVRPEQLPPPCCGDAGAHRPAGHRRRHDRPARRTCRPRPSTGRSSFRERVWHVRRPRPEPAALAARGELIRVARRPLLVAGGGVSTAGRPTRCARSSRPPASPSPRPRPARAPCPSTTRRASARRRRPARTAANALAARRTS